MAAQWETRLKSKLVKYPFSLIPGGRCIYHVPLKIRETCPEAYTPYEVSIGPMFKSRGSPSDAMKRMEEIKKAYCNAFINRARREPTDFSGRVREMEASIKNSYENPPRRRLLETVFVDSCFILELFLKVYALSNGTTMEGDPLVGSRKENDIDSDLTLLENQVPFSVLQAIYDSAALGGFPSLLELSCNYFEKKRPGDTQICRIPLHFTDLLRDFMLPPSPAGPQQTRGDIVDHVYTISQLWDAGAKFQVKSASSFLDIDFHNGELRIPKIKLDEASEVTLRNIVAFEQCHYLSDPPEYLVAEYLFLLHLLVRSEQDAQILIDNKIIVNWAGDISAIPAMFTDLCSKVLLNDMSSRYVELCRQLNRFRDTWWMWFYKCRVKAGRVMKYNPFRVVTFLAAVASFWFAYRQTHIAEKAYAKSY